VSSTRKPVSRGFSQRLIPLGKALLDNADYPQHENHDRKILFYIIVVVTDFY